MLPLILEMRINVQLTNDPQLNVTMITFIKNCKLHALEDQLLST